MYKMSKTTDFFMHILDLAMKKKEDEMKQHTKNTIVEYRGGSMTFLGRNKEEYDVAFYLQLGKTLRIPHGRSPG